MFKGHLIPCLIKRVRVLVACLLVFHPVHSRKHPCCVCAAESRGKFDEHQAKSALDAGDMRAELDASKLDAGDMRAQLAKAELDAGDMRAQLDKSELDSGVMKVGASRPAYGTWDYLHWCT